MRSRLALAIAASLAVILLAPFVGQLRGAIQAALPGYYRYIIGGIVLSSVAVAIVAALVRIRDRRLVRHALLASAVTVAVIYATATSTGNRDVDVVEQFHFVEYGVLAFLYFRAWRHREDITVLLFPLLAGIVVGTLDESFQWFIPARVGELHDVLLNVAAIGCGLVFSVGLDLPLRLGAAPDRRGGLTLAAASAAVGLLVAVFFYTVHLGFDIQAGPERTFRSRFSETDLREAERDRGRRWMTDPPAILHRVSREDQYLAEGLWHVQERNLAVSANDLWTAWNENAILETFFAPVLTSPSYGEPHGASWPAEQRADIAARSSSHRAGFVSTAHPFPIYTWSRTTFWLVTTLLLGIVVAGSLKWRVGHT